MLSSRFFEWFQFGVLVCWGAVGLTRAILFRARGVSVIAADRQRTPGHILVDTLAGLCLLGWAYEVIARAWHFPFQLATEASNRIVMDSVAVKIVGAVIASAAVLLYAVAVVQLGESWRLGIDRNNPGPLITRGVYRWSRHPIYLAFDLLFLATFLMLGGLMFLLLALVWMPLMHAIMLREERFLNQHHGPDYRQYCDHTGRYFPRRTT